MRSVVELDLVLSSQTDLTNYVKKVSIEDFGCQFLHTAHWNNRLRTTGGRFFPNDRHLDFNPKIYREFGIDIFRKIVRHELCHYHLYIQGKGYQHRDKAFKELLEKVDGLRYTPRVTAVKVNYHHYSCQSCGQVYRRRRRVNLRKFACGYCHGRLIESF